MKLYRLEKKQLLPITLTEAWDFFSNPANLKLITPSSLGLEFTSELPERTYAGLLITYRVRPVLGIALNWVTEITHVDEPHSFIDEQRFGPYRFWHHRHLFTEIEGGVEVRDLVHYGLPMGALGRLANTLVVRRQLEDIFSFRSSFLEKHFGTLTGEIIR